MSDDVFERAVKTVLEHEGGFVDDADDPGGATNWGISLRYAVRLGEIDLDGDGHNDLDFDMDGDVDAEDIRQMSMAVAVGIYRDQWWDKYGYGELPEFIGPKVFDLSVNMGARQAHKCLQRACRACGQAIADDGIIGNKTQRAIDEVQLEAWDAEDSFNPLLTAVRSEAAGFYRGLIMADPVRRKYQRGWLRRAYA